MRKETLFGTEAREKIKAGVDMVAKAVAPTLGPKGRSAILGYGDNYGSLVIDDGVTIARFLSSNDLFENEGIKLIKEVAGNTDDKVGDGTSTSTVLTQAMLSQGIKNITSGANPTLLKKGIQLGVEEVIKKLKDLSTPVKSSKDVAKVATVSSNDVEMGEKVAQAIDAVGSKGVVSVEEGDQLGIKVDVVDGMQISSGYINPYFGALSSTCTLHNPLIAVIEKRFQFANEIVPMCEYAVQHSKPILFLCDDMTGSALQTIVSNYIKGTIQACVVKFPSGGKNKKEIVEDICAYTGATLLGSSFGDDVSKWEPETLGKAERVDVDENYTVIRVTKKPAEVNKRVKAIDEELKTAKLPSRIEHLNLRKAGLTSGIALIKILAATKTETEAKKAKLEDAKNAALASLEEGIIPGGGTALVRCESVIDDYIKSHELHEDIVTGLKIVKDALGKPVQIIAQNTGHSGEVVLDTVRKGKGDFGFNAETEAFENLMKSGVIDATKVIKTALQNAASVVSTVLMTECVSVVVPEENKK